jgi:hypothetical protein
MEDLEEEDWEEEDWENITIPDLLISNENRERERRLIEQRKLVEDADAELAESLFSNEPKDIKDIKVPKEIKEIKETQILCNIGAIEKKEKPKDLLQNRQNELREKQIEDTKKKREQKENKLRLKDTYGEAEEDVYDDMYGDIANKY